MESACWALYALIALFGRLVYKKWSNLLTVFMGFYSIIIFLANLRLWNINGASAQTFIILIVGGLSFTFGHLLGYRIKFKIKSANYSVNTNDDNLCSDRFAFRKYVVYFALGFVVLFTLYSLVRAVLLLRSGASFIQLRHLYFNDDETGYGRNLIDLYIYLPILQALVFVSSVAYFSEAQEFSSKERFWVLFTVFACEIMSMFTNGGRENTLYFILTVLFAYLISGKKRKDVSNAVRKIWKKRKRLFFLTGILAMIAVIIMTQNRSRTGDTSFNELKRTFYFYFAGWLPNLSERLSYLDEGSYTYGYTAILGLIRLPATIIHRIIPASSIYKLASGITHSLQERVLIGGGRTFNAYVSLFYYFYRDFGLISVFLDSFLFGAFCGYREKRFNSDKNIINMFWLLFAFFLIISSMVRWELVHIKTAMIVYYAFIFFKPRYSQNN